MKTYLKGINTLVVIFLSLALFSCQEEQIEQVDTLSTTPDQDMLKPGKGNGGGGGRVNYTVSLEPTDTTPIPLLVTSEDCIGTCNNTQTLLWFSSDCSTSFYTGVLDLNLQSIRLNFDNNESQVIMGDGTDKYFSDPEWDGPEFVFDLEGGTYVIDQTIEIFKKVGKGKHRTNEPAGFISIGQIVITPN